MPTLPPAEDCHYQVTITYERQDEKELFVTAEAAKEYARDMLQKDDVVKATIKKVEPKEGDDAQDGQRLNISVDRAAEKLVNLGVTSVEATEADA